MFPFAPTTPGDWMPQTISLPTAARGGYTIFRFRYYPGTDPTTGISSGNNFYLDHFNFNGFPESVALTDRIPNGATLQPNPTQGGTSVIIKNETLIQSSTIIVTDVTGNKMYETTNDNIGTRSRVEIPAGVFPSKGLYLVHVITGAMNQTEKLVVY